MSSDRAFSGTSISRSRFRAIQRVSVDRPTPRFLAISRRVRPLVRARRTASSSNSCVNPFCFVIEFTFHPRKTLHFFEASPLLWRSPRRSHRTERVGHHGYPDTSHHYCSCSPPWRRRLVRPGTLVLGGRQGARRGSCWNLMTWLRAA